MSFPASLTTRTVKGRFVTYPAGAPAKGEVRIVLETLMQGPTDDTIVAPFDKTFKFGPDTNGEISVELPSNNDPQWTPGTYRIVITVDGKVTHRQKFDVPYNGSGTLYLDDILNVPVSAPAQSYVLLASKGAPGGVASLNEDGVLEADQVPAGLGGAVGWDDVEDKPTTFPPSTHTHAFDDVTGKPSTYPPSTHTHAFDDVTGKPSTYPPSTHSHETADVDGLDAALSSKASTTDLTDGLAEKANTSHNHAAGDITSGTLSAARGGTGLSSFTSSNYLRGASSTTLEFRSPEQVLSDIGAAAASHSHPMSDVTGLSDALAAKSDTSHTHAWGAITDKPTTFPSNGTITGDLAVSGFSGLHGTQVDGDLEVTGYASFQGLGIAGDVQVPNIRVTSGTYMDGPIYYNDVPGAGVIVLDSDDPIPTGTPVGTVVVRTA